MEEFTTSPYTMMISVILCTRGLIFTQVEEAIKENLSSYTHKIYRSFNLPIPDCQNVLVEKALKEYPDYLLFVEEDVVIPDNGVKNMLYLQGDIVCIDYGVAGYSCITRRKENDEILWCGLGCTLIKKEVFEKLSRPYFRSDKKLLLNDWPIITWIDIPNQRLSQEYGGQDIWFCMEARKQGFTIQQAPGEAKHLKLDSLGKPEVNHGLHAIGLKEKITKYQTI